MGAELVVASMTCLGLGCNIVSIAHRLCCLLARVNPIIVVGIWMWPGPTGDGVHSTDLAGNACVLKAHFRSGLRLDLVWDSSATLKADHDFFGDECGKLNSEYTCTKNCGVMIPLSPGHET